MATTLRPEAATRPANSVKTGSAFTSRLDLGRIASNFSSHFVWILSLTLILTGLGLVMVLSSSTVSSYNANSSFFADFIRQGIYAMVGVPLMLVISRFPVAWFRRYAWLLFGFGIVFQLAVFTPLGLTIQGNRNWISIAGFTAQPSEILKLVLIIWLAQVLAMKAPLLGEFKHLFIPGLIGVLGAVTLILLGRDLGTTMILTLAVFGALFFSQARTRHIWLMLGVSIGVIGALAFSNSSRVTRILQWAQSGCTDVSDQSCWQPIHGMWALANGGIFGVGLGNSTTKWGWLPAATSDYIFAIIGEELGLIGAVVVILLFLLLAVGFLRLIAKTDDPFSKTTVAGLMFWLIGQAFVNIAVVVGLAPVLGVPLPFVSAGGSALISSLMAVGVVLAIARETPSEVVSTMAKTRTRRGVPAGARKSQPIPSKTAKTGGLR